MSFTWPQEAGAASSMRLAAALARSRFLEPVTPGTFRSPAP